MEENTIGAKRVRARELAEAFRKMDKKKVRELYEAGYSCDEIAKKVRISPGSVINYLREK